MSTSHNASSGVLLRVFAGQRLTRPRREGQTDEQGPSRRRDDLHYLAAGTQPDVRGVGVTMDELADRPRA